MSDASCRLLGVVREMLEERGISAARLVEGTGLSLAQIEDQKAWLGWDDFCEVMSRASALLGGEEELLRSACAHMNRAESNRSVLVLLRALAGPQTAYWALCRWIAPQLFSCVSLRIDEQHGRTLRIHMEVSGRRRPMPELRVMVQATLVTIPTAFGLGPSSVCFEGDANSGDFIVETPAARSLWGWMRRVFSAVFAPSMMVRELEHQAETLRARNEALEQARRAESSLSETRQRLLTHISHELRTPLNGILGSVQLLETSDLEPEQRSLLASCKDSAEHLVAMVEAILAFNRVHEGEEVMEAEGFDLTELVRERVAAVAPRAAEGVQLRVEVPEGEWVRGDRGWLARSLDAVLDNAVYWTHAGSVVCRGGRDSEGKYTIEVEDTGSGMSPEVMAKALDPLQLGNDELTRSKGGLGLGLPLVDRIMSAMGGRVVLKSELGRGTTAWLQAPLPATQAPPELVAKRRCILVVDDQALNRRLLSKLLAGLGFETEEAENGREAVDKAEAGHFDAILMDCQMPVLDGYEATKEIRAREGVRGGHVPILAVTAHASDADRLAAFDAGMDRHLTKPVRKVVLEGALAELLS